MPDRSFLDWPFFEERHRRFAAELGAWAEANCGHVEGGDVDALSAAYVRRLGADGWLEHTVGRFDVRTLALARETLAYRDGLADFAFVMQGLGTGPISLFGSAEQQARWLPAVGRGEAIAALAMSERDAGSDVGAIATAARDEGEYLVLDGEKTWISNGGIADLYSVVCRMTDAPGTRGLGVIVVEKDAPGFSVPERIETIAPHPLGTLRFENCRVPRANLIGKAGDGFKIAMANLDVFRSTVGAAALGFARRALDEALARVQERRAFGQRLAEFQLTQARLADMATAIDASALLIYRAAWTKDGGAARVTREASMAKMYATEAAQQVVDSAVQLFGGLGVKSGGMVERLYREVRALRIYEGTTEINKLVIAGQTLAAFGQRTGK